MKLRNTLLAASFLALMASCSSSKTVLPYFIDIQSQVAGTLPEMDYSPEIKPDDELLITVTSMAPEATAIYNLPLSNPALKLEMFKTTSPSQQTFVVDSKGDISFPVLGSIHVAGMTVDALRDYLVKRISEDVEDPLVMVSIVNFNVVVAGEVRTPRTIQVGRNRYSILDALSDAGDLTEYGERANVLIVREENGERKFAHLNLNSSDLLTSPYFYLKQNDYIYVSPNDIRQANSKYNQNNSYKLTVISTIVSASSVIASLVIALTVK